MLNFILPAVAAIGSALIGKKGQEDTNAANVELSREGMAFNAEQADINRQFNAYEALRAREWSAAEAGVNRDFQAEMANTSYQRAVGDLRKAGLNPMLAYSQGGASSPAGNMPSGSSASGSAASSGTLHRQESSAIAGLNAAATALQLQNLNKQGTNIDADTALKNAQAHREAASAAQVEAVTSTKLPEEVRQIRENINVLMKEGWNKTDQGNLLRAQEALARVDQMLRAGQIGQVEASTALSKVETLLKQLAVPEARAYSEKFSSEYGSSVSPYIREILDIVRTLIYGSKR